jgi:DNA polymerase-3 subunit epsilon
MLLFIDTETTGLPGKKYSPYSSLSRWPRLVEVAWIECEIDGTTIAEYNSIIKPDSFSVPHSATTIHGITTERAHEEGSDIISVLKKIDTLMSNCSYIVGHNVDFDLTVIAAEFIRAGIPMSPQISQRICTMKSSVKFCKLKRGAGYKYPTLAELHHFLFGLPLPESHRALGDVRACMKCFFELKKRGIL